MFNSRGLSFAGSAVRALRQRNHCLPRRDLRRRPVPVPVPVLRRRLQLGARLVPAQRPLRESGLSFVLPIWNDLQLGFRLRQCLRDLLGRFEVVRGRSVWNGLGRAVLLSRARVPRASARAGWPDLAPGRRSRSARAARALGGGLSASRFTSSRADRRLTTRNLEWEKRFEPSTSTLARRSSSSLMMWRIPSCEVGRHHSE